MTTNRSRRWRTTCCAFRRPSRCSPPWSTSCHSRSSRTPWRATSGATSTDRATSPRPSRSSLFDRDGLGEVARSVDVAPEVARHGVREDLEWHDVDHGGEHLLGRRNAQHVVRHRRDRFVVIGGDRHDGGAARLHLGQIGKDLLVHRRIGRDHHDDDAGFDKGERPVLELAGRVTLGVQVTELLQLECTFERRGKTHVAAQEEEVAHSLQLERHGLERRATFEAVAFELKGVRDFFFLGRHVGFPTALEGALKLKELSYLHAEGYPAGELKHGPLALIEPGVVVVVVATDPAMHDKMLSKLAEVKARGASVVAVATDDDESIAAVADYVLRVPATEQMFTPMVDIVPLQIFAYAMARNLGRNVDRPRNLAKTVTVE